MQPQKPPPDSNLADRFKPYHPSPLREVYPSSAPPSPPPSSEDVSSAVSRSSEGGNDPEDGGGYDGDKDEEENEPGQADAKRSRQIMHAAQRRMNKSRASEKARATKQRQDKNAVAWSGPTTRAGWRRYISESASDATTMSISEAASDATTQRSKSSKAVSGSSILARNLQMLGVNAGQGEMRKACETAFEQGRDLLIDHPLSYNQTVTVYFMLCLNLLKKLKQQGYIPENVDEQVEDPRTKDIDYSKATEDSPVDSPEHSSTQEPVDTQPPSTVAFSPVGTTSSLPEQLAENPGGDGSSLEEEDIIRLTIEEDEGGGVPGEQDNPIVISEDSISEGYTSSEQDRPLTLPHGQANPTGSDNPIVVPDDSNRLDTSSEKDWLLKLQPTGIQPTIERNSITFDAVILCSSPDLAICYYDIVRTLMRGVGLAVSLAIETDKHESQEQEISRGCNILITDLQRLVKLIQVFETKISVLVVEDVNGVFQNSHKNELKKLNNVCTQETRFIFISPWWNSEARSFLPDLFLASQQRIDSLICNVGEEFVPTGQAADTQLYAQHEIKVRATETMEILYERFAPLKKSGEAKVLILCREAQAADILWYWVEKWGFVKRTHLTDRAERDRILDGWNSGKIRAVVTTEDLADGMAMEGITDLVTWQLPMNEDIRVSEWKYWRRLERDHMEAPRTLVFIGTHDHDLFPFVARIAALGEPSVSGNLERLQKKKDFLEAMWKLCLPNQRLPDEEEK